MCSLWKISESSRLKIAGPAFVPKAYPKLSPKIAAKNISGANAQIFKKPWDAKKPAVNNRESPGRKKPTNKPDSAKIIAKSPKYPAAFISSMRSTPGIIKSDKPRSEERRVGK